MEPVHVFAGNPLDRAEAQRRDESWIQDQLHSPESRFLPLWNLKVLVTETVPLRLAWRGPAIAGSASPAGVEPVLLGLLGGKAHIAIDLSHLENPRAALEATDGLAFRELRDVSTAMDQDEAAIAAQARWLVDWHSRHLFSPTTGCRTIMLRGGGERYEPEADRHHFPRTDPVVIAVVHNGDYCLLGRTRARATGFYSALAGFMEAGETVEEAVRREVWEEAGVRVGRVTYHSSQPWPFPASLMIGCLAEASSTEVFVDGFEMSDVRWISREEAKEALRTAGRRDAEGLRIPGPIAIAHHLIKAWALGK